MRQFRKYACVFLIALLAFMWLKEVTMRRAFEVARDYVYPFESLAPYSYTVFSIVGTHRPSDRLTGPGWLVSYGNSTVMPTVAVSIFGNVQGSNYQPLDDVLGLSPDDRQKALTKWVKTKQAEQRAAPLPPAPAGPSDGAR